jgi:hypothetical protein
LRSSPFQIAVLGLISASASLSWAQITPAAGHTPPDDTPAAAVGVTIFTNYTNTTDPKITDADGNSVSASAFEVARAYVNVTGKVSHLVSFRVTPDVAGRFSTSLAAPATGQRASTNYDGSLVFRLKYAFGQLNLDDWLPKGSWVRFGQQQTPVIDFLEGVYRYRFQNNTFPEKEGLLSSSDVGLSAHYAFVNDYGDIHVGYYNGDTYTRAEPNDQKALQGRFTVRPLPRKPVLKGLRLTAFYDADKYVKSADRNRFVGSLTFEHKNLNLGADYVDAKDQTSAKLAAVKSNGWDVWVTPRLNNGIEGFFRYDNFKPNKDVDALKKRTMFGAAYWFKTAKSAAVMADYEGVDYDAALNKAKERRFAIHCLFNF